MKTSKAQMKEILLELVNMATESEINVNVTFQVVDKEISIDIAFLDELFDNFSILLFQFFDLEFNNKLKDRAFVLMQDKSKFQEIKQKVRTNDFRNS